MEVSLLLAPAPAPMASPRFRSAALPAALLLVTLLPACAGPGGDVESEGEVAAPADLAAEVTTFRVRADLDAGLAADTGWAAAPGEAATVRADHPFRLRFEVAGDEGLPPTAFRLEFRREGGAWSPVPLSDFPYPAEERGTPGVALDSVGAYTPAASTGDLLAASDLPFRPGFAVSGDSLTPAWDGAGAQGEFEWPVVIRRWADGPVTNEEGDVFELRMASADGRPLRGATAHVDLTIPPGHLGGTFVETPGRLGPWQASDGSLYFVMEPTETDNVLMVVKSDDGGATWREVDGADRPVADDLEGFATAFHDGVVHMLHQQSEVVWHHAFATTDAADAPEGWLLRDREVSRPGEPPTQVATLVARSDGSLVAVYGGPEKLRLRIRDAAGAWGEERVVDADVPPALSGPQAVLGFGDVVHLAYTGLDGSVWFRSLTADGTLGPRALLGRGIQTGEEGVGSVAPPVYVEERGEVVVVWRLADGTLQASRIPDGGEPGTPVRISDRAVVQSAVDSDQVGADLVAHAGTVHLLFIDQETGDLWHTRSDGSGRWSFPEPVVEGITAQWVRGNVVDTGAGPVYGFVYDAGSDGGTGMNRYAEIPLGR